MLGFGKKARERRRLEETRRNLLETALRMRLHGLVDSVVTKVTDVHELSLANTASVEKCAENIKAGIDFVLLDRIGWTDERIPISAQGGAMIANSAHAHFFFGIDLDDPTIFDLIGTENDKQTAGHICYNLGFSRDGEKLRI